ncbi:hypothetical protein V6N12_066961 [Hibiscus sabdariffa]|uniref:Uncharacterized protein n=1 Tax=Hibiscus sabdariffa TaxID=183260 RepID=A0ABR2AU16_9ROSI
MEAQNPNSDYGVLTYLNIDGRPSDQHAGFDSLQSLEWPSSPTLLEDQPLVNKNKNDIGMDMNGDIAAMDADGEERRPEIVTIRDDVGGVLEKGSVNTITYASVTAKSTQNESSQKPTIMTTDEDIVILEEDKLEYEGLFTCGIFGHTKEFCDTFKSQASENAGVDLMDRGKTQVEVSEDNLFGPWMVAENQHRRVVTEGRLFTTAKAPNTVGEGSHFGVLQMDEDTEFLQRVEPIQSNHEKWSKSRTGDPSLVKVVLSLGGNTASSVMYKPRISTGKHEAIVITEQGIQSVGTTNARERRARTVGVKTILGTAGHISKGRKSSEAPIVGNRGVSEFIEDLSDRLDTTLDHIMPNPSLSLMEMDRGENGLGGTEVSSSDNDSRYNEDHGDEVIPVEQ